jgi:Rod binding domain-containing protein
MPTDSLLSGVLSTPGITTGADASLYTTGSPKTDNPEKTHNAAVQFEALLVGQILKSSHEEDGGWLGAGEDQTAGAAMQMADEYFARAISEHGGLGLAKMITQGLDKATAEAASRSNPEN